MKVNNNYIRLVFNSVNAIPTLEVKVLKKKCYFSILWTAPTQTMEALNGDIWTQKGQIQKSY